MRRLPRPSPEYDIDLPGRCAGGEAGRTITAVTPAAKGCRAMIPPGGRDRPRSAGPAAAGAGGYSAASAYASGGAQVHTRFRSPYTLSTRFTGGQYFAAATHGSGNAAWVRV